MNIGVIIAEYNPFHTGHAKQLAQVRACGVTHLAVVMSGQFVQRGDIALFSKWTRAKAAILSGADLVVELPTSFAMAPARNFAKAGVFLASQFQEASLFFGAECNDIALLQAVAEAVQCAEEHPLFLQNLATGVSHPKAREQTVLQLFSKHYADLLCAPNNLLGLEYLRAIKQLGVTLHPHALSRIGVNHHAITPMENIASASFLRELCTHQPFSCFTPYVPATALSLYQQDIAQGIAPMHLNRLERIILAHLRNISPIQLQKIAGVSEGLEHRIVRIARQASSLQACLTEITTKRYPTARIRRILLLSLLTGLMNNDNYEPPQAPAYLRVLACNEKGTALLRHVKRHGTLPIVSRFSTVATNPQAIFEAHATDFAGLSAPLILPAGLEFTQRMCVFKTATEPIT